MCLKSKSFGISPDDSDGSLESLLIVLLVMIAIAIWMHLPNNVCFWGQRKIVAPGANIAHPGAGWCV